MTIRTATAPAPGLAFPPGLLEQHAKLCAEALASVREHPGLAALAGRFIGRADGLVDAFEQSRELKATQASALRERAEATYRLLLRRTWPPARWCREHDFAHETILPLLVDFATEAEYDAAYSRWTKCHYFGPERDD